MADALPVVDEEGVEMKIAEATSAPAAGGEWAAEVMKAQVSILAEMREMKKRAQHTASTVSNIMSILRHDAEGKALPPVMPKGKLNPRIRPPTKTAPVALTATPVGVKRSQPTPPTPKASSGPTTGVGLPAAPKPKIDYKQFEQDGSVPLFITKPWYAIGPMIKGKTKGKRYMDDNAVRARAALLNATAWFALLTLQTADDPQWLLYTIAPVVVWDMFSAAMFGLTPLSPYGVVATLLTWNQHPVWKPAQQKRFAWTLGTLMVSSCMVWGSQRYKSVVTGHVLACLVLTWAEAGLDFCLGCWVWNNVMARLLGMQECEECKMEVGKPSSANANANALREVLSTLASHPVVVFSKTYCPHCKKAKKLLKSLGATYFEFEVDTCDDPPAFAAALVTLTGQTTVPNVFINGRSIGGSDDTHEMHANGELVPSLIAVGAIPSVDVTPAVSVGIGVTPAVHAARIHNMV